MTTEERPERFDERQLADAPKVIRANEFILEDENGVTRAVLSALKDGPNLVLYDEKGNLVWYAP